MKTTLTVGKHTFALEIRAVDGKFGLSIVTETPSDRAAAIRERLLKGLGKDPKAWDKMTSAKRAVDARIKVVRGKRTGWKTA